MLPVRSPVSLQIKASVPAKATGRLLDAITDIIRPFTEKRGLRADQIRLQREEVALKISELACKRLAETKANIRPISTKGMVQLLEKASLEEPTDKTMISMWANLLATAATSGDENLPRHVGILSEITSAQAKLLKKIVIGRRSPAEKLSPNMLDDTRYNIGEHLRGCLREEGFESARAILDSVRATLNIRGHAIIDIHVDDLESDDIKDLLFWPSTEKEEKSRLYNPDHEIHYSILRSIGLLEHTSFKMENDRFAVEADYYRVTYLGVDLYMRCDPDSFTLLPILEADPRHPLPKGAAVRRPRSTGNA